MAGGLTDEAYAAGAGPGRGAAGCWCRRRAGGPRRRWPGWRRRARAGSAGSAPGWRRPPTRCGPRGRGVRDGGRPGRRPARLGPPGAGRSTPAIGYPQLWAADPGAWRAGGGGLARAWPRPVDRRAGELAERAPGGCGRGWSGGAPTAAGGRLAGLRGELTDGAARADRGRPGARRVRRPTPGGEGPARRGRRPGRPHRRGGGPARCGIRPTPPAVRAAAESGAAQASHRRPARRAGGGPEPAGSSGGGGRVTTALRDALDLADAADREAAARLAELARAAGTGWVDPAAARPTARRSRARRGSARWWTGLTPGRSGAGWSGTSRAGSAGWTGCRRPPATRPTGCCSAARREELLAERPAVAGPVPPAPADSCGAGGGGELAGLDALAERLASPAWPAGVPAGARPGRRRPGGGGAGRPGPGRAGAHLRAGDDRRPGRRPGRAGPGGAGAGPVRGARAGRATSAAVLWLDYDAPDFLDRGGAAPARPGTPARRCTGSRRGCAPPTRGRRPGRPCSGTATARWWWARPPVTTGWPPTRWSSSARPGSASTHAAELGVPAGQVWASTAPRRRDPPGPARRTTWPAVPCWPRPPLAAVLGWPDRTGHELWFGHDPSRSRLRRPGLPQRPARATPATGSRATRRWTGWPGSCWAADAGPARSTADGPRPPRARMRAGAPDGRRYSTVTDLARLRGWSTSWPRAAAISAGEHLQRHGGHQRRQQGRRTRHVDQVVGVAAGPPRRPPRRSRWCGRRGRAPPGCWRRPCRAARPGRPATAPRRPPGCPRRSARSGRASARRRRSPRRACTPAP